MDMYKDLSLLEFKLYSYIKMYNDGRKEFYIPAEQNITAKTNISRASVFRGLSSLRSKGVLRK